MYLRSRVCDEDVRKEIKDQSLVKKKRKKKEKVIELKRPTRSHLKCFYFITVITTVFIFA